MSAVTGISGIQLSAASAAYAPTNSADVSAIASAYQVVSATATQLNAGTAYVTSINETPISAARAGNAANASLANSAWYDGTGRVISSLPDEATVSSIASAYTESAASSKLDESATADFYSTSNPSGFITGVDLSDYATTAYVDSSVSSFVDSAYVESQVSGKEDKLTFGYDDAAISSINGSALAGGGAQVVTSLQYATSESATVATTVTADTAVGYGARDISADYYDYGYGPWTDYDSSRPLVQVRMTAVGNMTNYSSNPYYLYVVPYGATNDGNVSTTSQLTDALSFGEFSGGMNDLIVAEGTGSANSQDPYVVEVNFDVTHVPFIGSEPAYWGTVEGSYAVVDNNEYTRPVFCVAGGYDGSQLFELRGNTTAELDFGSVVTVSAVSGINELEIAGAGGGIDSATVSAIASSYAEDVSAAASGAVSAVSSNSASWMKLSSFSGLSGIVTAVGSSNMFPSSASSFMGIGSAIKSTIGSGGGFVPNVNYTMGLSGYYPSVKLSAHEAQTYVKYMDDGGSISTIYVGPTALITGVSGDISAYSTYGAFTLDYTANSIEPLAFQNDLPYYSYDSNSAISAINGSALAGGGGGGVVTSIEDDTVYVYGINGMLISAVEAYNADYAGSATRDNSGRFISSLPDSAAVSAIASAYALPKLDISALDRWQTGEEPALAYSGINGIPIHPTMADYAEEAYTAESAGSATYAESADYWFDASSKADSSALSSYALSADVSGTVDLVSTQSANWGGSALALSAGPGVKLEKVGDTLVASTDETVLWSGACLTQGGAAATLSEAASNFDKIAVYAVPNPGTASNYPQIFTYDGRCTIGAYMCPFMNSSLRGKFSYGRWEITNGTSFNLTDAAQTDSYPTLGFNSTYGGVIKVVGINRTAGV